MTPEGQILAPAHLRSLLAKLRDLDLHCPNLAIEGGKRVSIEGCLTLDSPAGAPLRYRLRWPNGEEDILRIEAVEGGLEVEILARDEHTTPTPRPVRLVVDDQGRATALDLRARVSPESADARELDHFLRRIVRGVLTAA